MMGGLKDFPYYTSVLFLLLKTEGTRTFRYIYNNYLNKFNLDTVIFLKSVAQYGQQTLLGL